MRIHLILMLFYSFQLFAGWTIESLTCDEYQLRHALKLSPDKKKLASIGARKILIYDLDVQQEKVIHTLEIDPYPYNYLSWTAHSDKLIFPAEHLQDNQFVKSNYLYDLKTEQIDTLPYCNRAAFSPVGNLLAYYNLKTKKIYCRDYATDIVDTLVNDTCVVSHLFWPKNSTKYLYYVKRMNYMYSRLVSLNLADRTELIITDSLQENGEQGMYPWWHMNAYTQDSVQLVAYTKQIENDTLFVYNSISGLTSAYKLKTPQNKSIFTRTVLKPEFTDDGKYIFVQSQIARVDPNSSYLFKINLPIGQVECLDRFNDGYISPWNRWNVLYHQIADEQHFYFLQLINQNSPDYPMKIYQAKFTDDIAPTDNLDNRITLTNYPNPFNPVTTISYQLPADAKVNIKVYNILGNEVATLISGQVKAGYHTVNFDGSSLASGQYFYKIETDNFVSIKKMLLLK